MVIYGVKGNRKHYHRDAIVNRHALADAQTLFENNETPIRTLDKLTGAPASQSPTHALQLEQARVFGGDLTDADLVRLGLLKHTQDPPDTSATTTTGASTAPAPLSPSISLASLPSPLPAFRTRSRGSGHKGRKAVSFVDTPSPLRTTTTASSAPSAPSSNADDNEWNMLSASVSSLSGSEAWELLGEDLQQ